MKWAVDMGSPWSELQSPVSAVLLVDLLCTWSFRGTGGQTVYEHIIYDIVTPPLKAHKHPYAYLYHHSRSLQRI